MLATIWRRAWFRFLLLGVLLIALGLVLYSCTARQTLPRARIYAQLEPNGDLDVTEQIDYDLAPGTLGLTRTLDAATLSDFAASALLPDGRTVQFLPNASAVPGDNGGMIIRQKGTETMWTLYQQFPAQGGRITATYRYTIRAITKRFSDGATLTYDALGKQGWPQGIADFSLRVALPLTQNDTVDAVMQRLPRGTTWNRSTDGVVVTGRDLPAGQRLTMRLDFSSTLLIYQQVLPGQKLADIRAAERAATDRARVLGAGWALACILMATGVLGWLYWRRHREEPEQTPLRHSGGPPMGITAPAELSTLMPYAEGVGARDLVAMLLHLIHRNHLALVAPDRRMPLTEESVDLARIVRLPGPRDTLLDGEFFLIHWFIDLLGDGKSVTLGQVRRTPRAQFQTDYKAWRRLVNRQIAERPWFEDMRREKRALMLPGGVMVLGTIMLSIMGASSFVWLGLPVGAGLIAYAQRMRRRTPAAIREVARWQALAQQIQDGQVDYVTSIAQWERILLYAEALGLGHEAAVALQQAWWESGQAMPFPDAGQATFLAWPLLEYREGLPRWFDWLCEAIASPCGQERDLRLLLGRVKRTERGE